MKCIIVDTSSVIFGLSNKVNVFESIKEHMPEYRIIISKGITKELKKIAQGGTKNRKFGKIALILLKQYNLEAVSDYSYPDNFILREAVFRKCAVCTNDVVLKRKLRSEGIKTLSIGRNGLLR